MNCYIFDFDGTLVDSSERLYKLFKFLVPESTFTKEEYWALKRNKINHQMILSQYFPQYSFEDFNKKWLHLIEQPEYLRLDFCYTDTIKVLDELSVLNDLYLLTARQYKINLFSELDRFDIKKYFKQVFVTENTYSKEDLLNQIPFTAKDYFISDMGKDIALGNKAHLQTVAISHGFMSRNKLIEYKPKQIITNLSELIQK